MGNANGNTFLINEEGVAICLCSFTATNFVTQESAGLLLLPQSDFVKTLRVKFTYITFLNTFFSSKLI